jgi:hypothetical protein
MSDENPKPVPPTNNDIADGNSKDEYEVGYGKPPKATQFKPGQSGNPKGRRKRSKNAGDMVMKLLQQKVDVNIQGRKKRLTMLEVIIKTHTAKAAKGDMASTRLLLELLRSHQESNADQTAPLLPEADINALLEAFFQQLEQGTPIIEDDD